MRHTRMSPKVSPRDDVTVPEGHAPVVRFTGAEQVPAPPSDESWVLGDDIPAIGDDEQAGNTESQTSKAQVEKPLALRRFRVGGRPERQSSAAADTPPGDPPGFLKRHRIAIGTLSPPTIDVILESVGQHTVSWTSPVRLVAAGAHASPLPVGSCNLYTFPAVITPAGEVVDPSDEPEMLDKALFVGIAADPACNFMDQPDLVGAYPIHGIAVANTDAAVQMVRELCVARPMLLTQIHVKHRAGFALFTGETLLHILAVNQQEDVLCFLISLAFDTLSRDEASNVSRTSSALRRREASSTTCRRARTAQRC